MASNQRPSGHGIEKLALLISVKQSDVMKTLASQSIIKLRKWGNVNPHSEWPLLRQNSYGNLTP